MQRAVFAAGREDASIIVAGIDQDIGRADDALARRALLSGASEPSSDVVGVEICAAFDFTPP